MIMVLKAYYCSLSLLYTKIIIIDFKAFYKRKLIFFDLNAFYMQNHHYQTKAFYI